MRKGTRALPSASLDHDPVLVQQAQGAMGGETGAYKIIVLRVDAEMESGGEIRFAQFRALEDGILQVAIIQDSFIQFRVREVDPLERTFGEDRLRHPSAHENGMVQNAMLKPDAEQHFRTGRKVDTEHPALLEHVVLHANPAQLDHREVTSIERTIDELAFGKVGLGQIATRERTLLERAAGEGPAGMRELLESTILIDQGFHAARS